MESPGAGRRRSISTPLGPPSRRRAGAHPRSGDRALAQALDAFRRAGSRGRRSITAGFFPGSGRRLGGVADGTLDLVVGTRSAIFLPFPDLRLTVVDEEQDGAYKQDESPRYQARDVALVRAQRAGRAVCLATARRASRATRRPRAGVPTPDAAAPCRRSADGDRQTRRSPRRLKPAAIDRSAPLPDSGAQRPIARNAGARRAGDSLLNRRGHSTYLQCRGCGHVRSATAATFPTPFTPRRRFCAATTVACAGRSRRRAASATRPISGSAGSGSRRSRTRWNGSFRRRAWRGSISTRCDAEAPPRRFLGAFRGARPISSSGPRW